MQRRVEKHALIAALTERLAAARSDIDAEIERTEAESAALATEAEVKDLRRTVRKLEDELRQMKNEQGGRRKINAAE